MSDPLDVGQWAKNWEAMARQAQAAMGGNTAQPVWGSAAASPPSWFENMAQAHSFSGGKQQSAAMEHLLAGAQGYLGMLQSLASGGMGQGASGFSNPFAAAGLSGAFPPSAMSNPFAAAMRGFGNQGAVGFDQMMEQFAAAVGPMFDKAKGALHMPAFGHLREKQENLQKTAQVFIDYQEQSARYDRLMLKVGEKAFARFQLKLAEREEPGRQIDSARGLYDVWIDAAEEAYAEIALSEEFREVYGAVVDAQMRVRQQVQGEIEKFCNQLGMPTRSEVNSIGERLQALRREFREERESTGDQEGLQAEVAELRRELEALKSTRKENIKSAALLERAEPVKATKPAKSKKSAKLKKAAKSPKAVKAPKAIKASKAKEAARVEVIAENKSTTKKTSRKKDSKVAPSHREKRRKSIASKSERKSVPITKSRAAKSKDAAGSGSFAASIARFARKSKTGSVSGRSSGAKPIASKRGGSK
ncbi:MAG: class III poly(R)-hydroxyalkanoic acid synthase subunit PhaE [Dokdonella sp.]